MSIIPEIVKAISRERAAGHTVRRVAMSKTSINTLCAFIGEDPYIPAWIDELPEETREFAYHDRQGHAFSAFGVEVHFDGLLPDGEWRVE